MSDVTKILMKAGVVDDALLTLMRRWGVSLPTDVACAHDLSRQFLDELRVAVDQVTDGGVPEGGAPGHQDVRWALSLLSHTIETTDAVALLAYLADALDLRMSQVTMRLQALEFRKLGVCRDA